MNVHMMTDSRFERVKSGFSYLLQRPSRMQVAALCHRRGKRGVEILLITSRDQRRWIIPKGWPMTNRSPAKAAKIEAFEEAGVEGKVAKQPIGQYRSWKSLGSNRIATNVVVYPLKVTKKRRKYKEAGERDLAWLPLQEAARQCNEKGLRDLLMSQAVREHLDLPVS